LVTKRFVVVALVIVALVARSPPVVLRPEVLVVVAFVVLALRVKKLPVVAQRFCIWAVRAVRREEKREVVVAEVIEALEAKRLVVVEFVERRLSVLVVLALVVEAESDWVVRVATFIEPNWAVAVLLFTMGPLKVVVPARVTLVRVSIVAVATFPLTVLVNWFDVDEYESALVVPEATPAISEVRAEFERERGPEMVVVPDPKVALVAEKFVAVALVMVALVAMSPPVVVRPEVFVVVALSVRKFPVVAQSVCIWAVRAVRREEKREVVVAEVIEALEAKRLVAVAFPSIPDWAAIFPVVMFWIVVEARVLEPVTMRLPVVVRPEVTVVLAWVVLAERRRSTELVVEVA
jgi:hypothetical protein